MRLITKKGMNVYGITLEFGLYVKSENIRFGGRCKQHRFANLKIHFYKWTLAHMFSLWAYNATALADSGEERMVETEEKK